MVSVRRWYTEAYVLLRKTNKNILHTPWCFFQWNIYNEIGIVIFCLRVRSSNSNLKLVFIECFRFVYLFWTLFFNCYFKHTISFSVQDKRAVTWCTFYYLLPWLWASVVYHWNLTSFRYGSDMEANFKLLIYNRK